MDEETYAAETLVLETKSDFNPDFQIENNDNRAVFASDRFCSCASIKPELKSEITDTDDYDESAPLEIMTDHTTSIKTEISDSDDLSLSENTRDATVVSASPELPTIVKEEIGENTNELVDYDDNVCQYRWKTNNLMCLEINQELPVKDEVTTDSSCEAVTSDRPWNDCALPEPAFVNACETSSELLDENRVLFLPRSHDSFMANQREELPIDAFQETDCQLCISQPSEKSYHFIKEQCSSSIDVTEIPDVLRETSEIHKAFPCPYCTKGFNKRYALKTHVRTHTGEMPFICSQCEKRFNKKSNLTTHMRIHTGEKPFSCPYCDKKFSQKSDVRKHLRTHTGEKPFPCPICNKMFRERSALAPHIRGHTGEKPFPCPQCEKRFPKKSNLVTHLRTHTGDKPFPCPHCDMRFTVKSGLTTHIRTHTGEQPHHCPYCDKRFSVKSALTRHIRSHTGSKPFTCSHCEKRFNQRTHLKTHMRTHTGEKPFSCPQCDKRFVKKSNLTTHLRKHT